MQKNVTIYDIARELNISPSTVSRVLNNSSHPVNPEIRKRVLEVSKRLNYVPNLQARNLKKQTSTTIGVLLPSVSNPFYPSILRGIEDEAVSNNYAVLFASCDRKQSDTDRYLQDMLEHNVRGIITLFLEYLPEAASLYTRHGGRIVSLVEEGTLLSHAHNITCNKVSEAFQATQHLIQLGHRKIAYLSDSLSLNLRIHRMEGFLQAVNSAGIHSGDYIAYINGQDIPLCTGDSVETGYLLAQAMLEKTPDITGILSMNDRMSLGIIRALHEKGMSIPADLSIVSFDDLFFSEYMEPPLTTMRTEKYQWGKQLMHYLLSLFAQETSEESLVISGETLLEPVTLVIRSSTAPPRQK